MPHFALGASLQTPHVVLNGAVTLRPESMASNAGFGVLLIRALRDHMRMLVLLWLGVAEEDLEQALRNWAQTWATYTRARQRVCITIHLLYFVAVRKLCRNRHLDCADMW